MLRKKIYITQWRLHCDFDVFLLLETNYKKNFVSESKVFAKTVFRLLSNKILSENFQKICFFFAILNPLKTENHQRKNLVDTQAQNF